MKRIILLIICLCLLCFSSCSKKQDENTTDDTTNHGTEITYVDVFFHDNEGTIVKTDKIPIGADIIRPPQSTLTDGFVFTGWDKSLSNIQEDTHFYPLYTDISEKQNVVFASTTYVTQEDEMLLNVQIGGDVNFACLEIQVAFDHTLLSLDSISNTDSEGVCYYDENDKTIFFAMASAQNINASVDLFTMKFYSKGNSFNNSEVTIKIIDIAAFDEKNELISVPSDSINGNIRLN